MFDCWEGKLLKTGTKQTLSLKKYNIKSFINFEELYRMHQNITHIGAFDNPSNEFED